MGGEDGVTATPTAVDRENCKQPGRVWSGHEPWTLFSSCGINEHNHYFDSAIRATSMVFCPFVSFIWCNTMKTDHLISRVTRALNESNNEILLVWVFVLQLSHEYEVALVRNNNATYCYYAVRLTLQTKYNTSNIGNTHALINTLPTKYVLNTQPIKCFPNTLHTKCVPSVLV